MQTIFENNRILVQVNSTGEVFVQEKKSKILLRISDRNEKGFLITSSNSYLAAAAGLAGIQTLPKVDYQTRI